MLMKTYTQSQIRAMLDLLQFGFQTPSRTQETRSTFSWLPSCQRNVLFDNSTTNIHHHHHGSDSTEQSERKKKSDSKMAPWILALLLGASILGIGVLLKPVRQSWHLLTRSYEIEPTKSNRLRCVMALTFFMGLVFLCAPMVHIYSMLTCLLHFTTTTGLTALFFYAQVSVLEWAWPKNYGDEDLRISDCQNCLNNEIRRQDVGTLKSDLLRELHDYQSPPPAYNPDTYLQPSAPDCDQLPTAYAVWP